MVYSSGVPGNHNLEGLAQTGLLPNVSRQGELEGAA